MSQSLAHVLLHLVFSTKDRKPYLHSPDLRNELNAYMTGIFKNQQCPSLIVNCVEDHIHMLFRLSRTITIAQLVEEVKKGSSKWLKTQGDDLKTFFGRAVTLRSPSANRTCRRSARTLPISKSITNAFHSRTNCGRC